MSDFHLPPMGFGPGSQPDPNGEELAYIPMPQEMSVYAPHLPEIEDSSAVAPALSLLHQIAAACSACAETGETETIDLSPLNPENRTLIADTLGEGEVSVKIRGTPRSRRRKAALPASGSCPARAWTRSRLRRSRPAP